MNIIRQLGWLFRQPEWLSLGLVAIVFVVDLSLPLGVASAVPYTFAVLIALGSRRPRFGMFVAGLCAFLTFAKMGVVSERGATELWKVIVNRCLAIFSIIMTLILGHLRRRSEWRRMQTEELFREHQATMGHLGRFTLMGQLAGNIAHELNQPLTAVCLQAELAAHLSRQEPLAKQQLEKAVQEIVAQSKRAADLIRSLRRLAKKQETQREAVPINEVIQTVLSLLNWRIARAEVKIHVYGATEENLQFLGDRIQIEQVLYNLIQNAIEAVMRKAETDRQILMFIHKQERDLEMVISDNGPGLREPGKVFEPFYTTKPDGLGLGLAISKSIIDAHGGRISAQQAALGGAEFRVSLPRVNE